jgi:hypothetical protein
LVTFTQVGSGFAVNHGEPGSILGTSGLQYDAKIDTLYVVDGADNSVTAISSVSTGPSMHVVFKGKPLNGPISSALLYSGNLVIGNTLNPNGKNLMVELTPGGKVLDVRNVDKGAAGSIFGMMRRARTPVIPKSISTTTTTTTCRCWSVSRAENARYFPLPTSAREMTRR